MNKSLASNWDVRIVPYEILSVDKNPRKYLSDVFALNNEQIDSISPSIMSKKVNLINNAGIYKNWFLFDESK